MPHMILAFFMISLVMAGFFLPPAQGAETASPPNISVEAEGKVMAIPDLARLTIEVETQAATATAAAQQNARQAEGVLKALKQIMGPEDKARTLGYRLTPIYSSKEKSSPPAIKAYRAVNRLEVKIMDVARVSGVLDTALKNGASQVSGPFWSHSRMEELQRQAAVDAWERARRLAEALAQAAGIKIKGVDKISTGVRYIPPRAAGANYLATKAVPPTPIEVGEEEVRAQILAVFLVSPSREVTNEAAMQKRVQELQNANEFARRRENIRRKQRGEPEVSKEQWNILNGVQVPSSEVESPASNGTATCP